MVTDPIFVKSITLRNGRVIYASQYGKKAFTIYPKDKSPEPSPAENDIKQ